MMVSVAVLGVFFAGKALRRRSELHRRLARYHSAEWFKSLHCNKGLPHNPFRRQKDEYHFVCRTCTLTWLADRGSTFLMIRPSPGTP
jgi:hypothetical protein